MLCPPKFLFGGGGWDLRAPPAPPPMRGEKSNRKGGQGRGFCRGMRVAPRSDMMDGGTIHSKL